MSVFSAVGKKLAEGAQTRMARARELGYNNDVFHSTNQDFGEVDISKGDIGFHVGTAEQANNRSKALAKQKSGYPFESDAYLEKEGIPLHREGSNVMPLKLRTSGNVLEMPDVGGWHRGELVARALYENKGGNIPESIQNKAFDISEKIEDYMETDAAYEHAMDVGKWAKSAENRKYLDELNQMIRDEGYSTIKYRNDVENDFLNRAAPKQDIVDRIDALQERKANTVDPQQRATLDIEISQAQEQALQSQADNAYSYIALDPADVRSTNAQFKDPTSKNILAGSAATAVGVGAMSQSNRTLAGTHPGDNADMSGLTLIPEMVSTVINDVYKYGKQAVTGKQDDGRLMETPESEGDAVAIKDAISKVADWGLNYRGAMGGPSGMDIIEGAMDAYTGTIRPALTSALGDAGTKRLEATGMLASMLLPAKNAKGALDIPEVDRDTKLLQRVGDPKSVNSLNVEFEEGPALLDNPMVKAEDIVNRPYVAGMSDTSRGALETLKSISGSEYNVLMEGGQDYMRQLRNANKGALWASDAGAITGMMNNAKGAMKLPGAKGSPLFFPYQMGGKSTDFATMTTDIMVPYAQRNMSKKDKKLVDKRIRDGAGNMLNDFTPQPDWPGVDSPKAMDWLKKAGTGRKAVVKALDEFRGEGSLNASQARAMIVDPTQINPKVANLQNVGQFDMSRDPMPGQHSTYNTDIMGNHLGRFGEGMNLLTDLNPVIRTSGKDFKQEMIKRGHNLEAEKLPAPVGKTMMPGLVGVLDERTVEELVKKGFVSP